MRQIAFVLLFSVLALTSASTVSASQGSVPCPPGYKGICASWYGGKFIGRQYANGETYHKDDRAIASRCRPFGQILRIRNLHNGLEVVAKVKDRGPYPWLLQKERVVKGEPIKPIYIDVTEVLAKELQMKEAGVVPIELEVLYTPPNAKYPCAKG